MTGKGGKRAARADRGRRRGESRGEGALAVGSAGGERLQKVLARAGVASRRQSEDLIVQGRVKVDGRVVTELGSRVDPERDRIEVDGRLLSLQELVYYVLNKPPGVVTTLDDPEGRPSVGALLREIPERVYPVGRLDYDAEGVLIVTNDGELANRLMHPRYGVRRTYDAKVRGIPSEATLDKLREGVKLEDGVARPLSVELVGRAKRNTWVRLEVTEGRPHLIKRLLEAVGHPVQRLRRVEYAGITADDLPQGASRQLTRSEVIGLRDALEHGELSGKGPRRRAGPPPGRRAGKRSGEEGS
ncbi:MAG: pseudouridine synthase [Myxococcota bacterium]